MTVHDDSTAYIAMNENHLMRYKQPTLPRINTLHNMRLDYLIKLNKGAESLRSEESVSVEEVMKGTVTREELVKYIYEACETIPDRVINMVLDAFGEAAMYFMADGKRVPIYIGYSKMFCTMRPDLKLKKRLTLSDIQKIDPSITELTPENIQQFISKKDLYLTAKFELEPEGKKLLNREVKKYRQVGVKVIPYKAKKRK